MELVSTKIPLLSRIRYSSVFKTLESIEKLGGFCAGGFARAMASTHTNEFSDIDVWCRDENSFVQVQEYLNENYNAPFSKTDYHGRETFKYHVHSNVVSVVVNVLQLVKTFGTPEEIMNGFDFTVCQAFIQGKFVHTTPKFREHDKIKRLSYTSLDAKGVAYRIAKYMGEYKFLPDMEDIRSVLGIDCSLEERRKILHTIIGLETRSEYEKEAEKVLNFLKL